MSLSQVQQNVIGWGVLLCIFLAVSILSNWQKNEYRRSILKSPAFANGHFMEFKTLGKGSGNGFTGYYSFIVNYETHGGQKTDERYRKLKSLIFRKTFPVLYNSKDPTKNAVLVFPSDFSNFNLPYPDSLTWVKALIDE